MQTQTFSTHEVENQPYALPNYCMWHSDLALQQTLHAFTGNWADAKMAAFGEACGNIHMRLGELANHNRPELNAFDRYGRRIDRVDFHPAYHALMQSSMQHEVHNFSWNHPDQAGAHVVRAALAYMSFQAEAGTGCPLTMTHAAVPTLMHAPELAKIWLPKLCANAYDARELPIHEKTACTIGMGMTEKQGGSDVRRNSTRAYAQPDGSYHLVGHKFFFSAPMCDAHLVLAQLDQGLSCFLMPRIREDGSLNAVRIQRLKDKLGDWSNASSEVEFQNATAYLVGEAGRGIANILEMVALTRLDCIVGSAALMRQALVQVLHHVSQRQAFGQFLIEQPIMQSVLADLAIESDAALMLGLRVAQAIDAAPQDPEQAAFARIATALGKYWVCKRTPTFVNEAQECLGGIGYVEENILPRLYRQAPLNSIWEGSGNVQCLDVLRACRKEPASRDALLKELQLARGLHPRYDQALNWLEEKFDDPSYLEQASRLLVERAAIALQASVLLRFGDADVAALFCDSRLNNEYGLCFGSLARNDLNAAIIQRAMPRLA